MAASTGKRANRKSAGKRELSKAATREKLLESARREFAKKGFHGTSVRELAAAAGVSTGAFYGNFNNKREIFDTIIEEIYQAIKTIMDRATEELIAEFKSSPSGQLTSRMVRATVDKIFRAAMDYTDLFHILRREGLGNDPDFNRQFNRVWESFVQATRRTLETYINAGLVKPYDTDMVARAVVPMSISMMLYVHATDKSKADDAVDAISAMLDGGIMKLTRLKEKKNARREAKSAG